MARKRFLIKARHPVGTYTPRYATTPRTQFSPWKTVGVADEADDAREGRRLYLAEHTDDECMVLFDNRIIIDIDGTDISKIKRRGYL